MDAGQWAILVGLLGLSAVVILLVIDVAFWVVGGVLYVAERWRRRAR